jgi:cytosine/adenosine deaminase-related metal-dependent hydrolase
MRPVVAALAVLALATSACANVGASDGADAAADGAIVGGKGLEFDSTLEEPDAAPDATPAPDSSPDGTAPKDTSKEIGPATRYLLTGTIVSPDTTYEGQVLVEGTTITCAEPGTACAGKPGAVGAAVIDTQGIISPGLIDTHNHILFDIFDNDDWLPVKTYTNHGQWPKELRYQAMLDVKQCLEDASQGKPTWCPPTYHSTGSLKCEMDKWGELKGIIAGTTSIVGLAGTTSACFSSVARTVDASQNGLAADTIQTSALFPPSKSAGDGVCANFSSAKTEAYLVHCGEGVDEAARAEWDKLHLVTTNAGCLLAPQTVITHGTAFTFKEFEEMATYGMKLTWSPASNVALYGATTNIPAALDAGVMVTLAPDWSMGGSQNLLDELRFADAWDDNHFGNRLSAKDLVLMTTRNPALALGLDHQLGAVQAGHLADLMVVARTTVDPYACIVAARPKDVRLTMVGGRLLYGDAEFKAVASQTPGCEDLDICGKPKFLCVAEASGANKLGQTHAEIKAALEAAMLDVDALTTADGFNFAPLAPLVKCD